jgi:hypothetical protein
MDARLIGLENPKGSYEVRGGVLAKRFTVAFKGTNGLAARKVKKALGSLFSDGVWPSLSATRTDKAVEAIYGSADKFLSTIALERATKALTRAFEEAYTQFEFFSFKKDSAVALEWHYLAVLACNDSTREITGPWDKELCSSKASTFSKSNHSDQDQQARNHLGVNRVITHQLIPLSHYPSAHTLVERKSANPCRPRSIQAKTRSPEEAAVPM